MTTLTSLRTMRAMTARKHIRAAIVGCGTVGGATAQLFIRDRELIAERSGIDVEIAAIVVRSFDNARRLELPEELLTTDIEPVLQDRSIDIVVELVGGMDFARTLITRSLDAGKHVVTANKALLAHHGKELFAHARSLGLSIAFEASCGGGIPLVRAITEGLIANEIEAIYGIVNGTSNYILTEMIQNGKTYPQALQKAQETGLAEADPSMDVKGTDSAHKIAIMSSLAFGISVDFDTIPVSGIDTLEAMDLAFGQDLGYVVKLLAVAYRDEEGVSIWVRPAFISEEHPLAWVSGPFNAVSIYGHAVGHTLFYGRGAGGEPTSSAVASDIIATAAGTGPAVFSLTGYWPDRNNGPSQLPAGRSNSQFYLRMMAEDKPGVLATISAILAQERISIASLRQNEQAMEEELIPLVFTTHTVSESALQRAVAAIDALPVTGDEVVVLPIVDEHPERVG